MKNKKAFKIADLLIALIESHREMLDILRKGFPQLPTTDKSFYKDAADTKCELHVSDSTLYRWRKEGLIDYTIMKGKIYYDTTSILKYRK